MRENMEHKNGLRIVYMYEARVQLCKALTYYGVQPLQSQYNFILLDLFKVKQLAFCSTLLVWHLAKPIHSVKVEKCMATVFENIYADHSIT